MDFYKERIELAAVFRWIAKLNMHESVVNHFSCAVGKDRRYFLINPGGYHFSLMKASDLILIDTQNINKSINELEEDHKPLITALDVHKNIHEKVDNAICVLHVHSKFATSISTIKNQKNKDRNWAGYLPPIDQNTMRFYERIVIDKDYGGLAKGDEAVRLSNQIKDKNILLLGHHGVLVVGKSIAKAFDDLYYFEKACETYVTALSMGQELEILSHEIAEKTAKQWENFKPENIADLHLKSIIKLLEKEDSSFKN